jgi:Flp pilus assembly protein TadD
MAPGNQLLFVVWALAVFAVGATAASAQQSAVYRALELEDAARWEEAAALYRAEIRGPESVQAAFGLERALLTLGRAEELASVLAELVLVEPVDGLIRSMYVRTLLRLERRAAARAFVEEWIAGYPAEPEAYRQLYAIAPLAAADARKLWRRIRAGGGSDSARTISDELAEHVLAVGLWSVAREILEDRYSRDGGSGTAGQLALAAARAGDVERARRVAREASLAPESPALGWLALYSGDLAAARGLLTHAADADPAAIQPLAALSRTGVVVAPGFGGAVLRLARGDTAGAARGLAASASEVAGAEPLLLTWAARLHASRGDEAAAGQLYESVARDYPQSAEAPEAILEQARLLTRAGRTQAAANRFEHLILNYPSSALLPAARRELDALRGRTPPAS